MRRTLEMGRTNLMLSSSRSRPHILVIINTAGCLMKVQVPGGGIVGQRWWWRRCKTCFWRPWKGARADRPRQKSCSSNIQCSMGKTQNPILEIGSQQKKQMIRWRKKMQEQHHHKNSCGSQRGKCCRILRGLRNSPNLRSTRKRITKAEKSAKPGKKSRNEKWQTH